MKPSNNTILNALCIYRCFQLWGVPLSRIFVYLRHHTLTMVAVPFKGSQIVVSMGNWRGDCLKTEWDSALMWLHQATSTSELEAHYHHWMTDKTDIKRLWAQPCAVAPR